MRNKLSLILVIVIGLAVVGCGISVKVKEGARVYSKDTLADGMARYGYCNPGEFRSYIDLPFSFAEVGDVVYFTNRAMCSKTLEMGSVEK